jgi:hypothetical protein
MRRGEDKKLEDHNEQALPNEQEVHDCFEEEKL